MGNDFFMEGEGEIGGREIARDTHQSGGMKTREGPDGA